jgi:hypothetical protein
MRGWKLAVYTIAVIAVTATLTGMGVVGVAMASCYAIMGLG